MKLLTHDQYINDVVAVVKKDCRCSVPGFQKIISFNFEDYGIAPMLLWDSEILIQEIIRNEFDPLDEGLQSGGDSKRRYRCRRCGRSCIETYTEFSISMYRSFVLFDDDLRASQAEYVLGFRGFAQGDFGKIPDFSKSADLDLYLMSLTKDKRD